MKKILLVILFPLFFIPFAYAEVKDLLYDGKEIYVHVKKDHLSTVVFPEPIMSVIRGFDADTYVVQRNDQEPNTLELMPTDSEVAEMTLTGLSGEEYVLRFVANDSYYTKLTVHKSGSMPERSTDKTITAKMNIQPETVIEKKEPVSEQSPEASNLPAQLNLKITIKGNNLPLSTYFSTISQVTGYNVITTPVIDAQKTSINLENIEVWRALKSLLYRFGYGFKVSREDLIITETETRIFNVTMPAVDQSFTDVTSNESFTDSNNNNSSTAGTQENRDVKVGTKIYYENTSPKLSLWADLESNVRSMITPKEGSYSVNKVSGSIIATDKIGRAHV